MQELPGLSLLADLHAAARDGAVVLDVVVQPRASRVKLGPVVDGRLRVAVTAPPVDGEANAAVVLALAEALRVPRRAVTIVRGETGRRKTVRVQGMDLPATLAALAAACAPA